MEPQTKGQTTEGMDLSPRGEETRARLLESGEAVFGELGYHDASVSKITERAEVAQGTFYRYFESKRSLFESLVIDLNRRVRKAMSRAAAEGETRVEEERLGFQAFFDFTQRHPTLYRIIRQAEFVAPDMLRYHYEKIAEGYVRGLSRAAANGEISEDDPEVLAWCLIGVGEMIGIRWMLWSDEPADVPSDVFDTMMQFIVRGLAADREGH